MTEKRDYRVNIRTSKQISLMLDELASVAGTATGRKVTKGEMFERLVKDAYNKMQQQK